MTALGGSGVPARRWIAGVLGLCALILAPTLTYRMGVDQGVFAYMGAGILDGRWPYLDTWESDFPGLMFLQSLQILLLGKSAAMFRLFDLLFQLANAYLVLRIATRVSGRAAGYVAAASFCLIYQGYGPWNTGQREGFGLLFVLVGFWLYLTEERRSALLTAAGIGLGLGVALIIKPTLLALALFYAPLTGRLANRRAWPVAAMAAAGLVAPVAAVVIGYWALGGLVPLYEACIAYQSIYTARLRGQEPLLIFWLQKLGRLGRNSVLLPLAYLPFLLARPARRERFMLWMGYLGSLGAVFVQGTFAGYHYLPGLGLGAILIGSMFWLMCDRMLAGTAIQIGRRRIAAPFLVAHVLLAAAAFLYLRSAPIRNLVTLRFLDPPVANEFRNQTVFDFTESFNVATYLRDRTRQEDTIQVWGYESLVYYLADRYAPARFQMTHPLVMRAPGGDLSPMQRRWRLEFLHDIDRRPPRYVAVVRQDHWWWAPEERTSEELLDDFPEWKRVIQREYRLEQTIGRFLIYRRANDRERSTLAGMGETMK